MRRKYRDKIGRDSDYWLLDLRCSRLVEDVRTLHVLFQLGQRHVSLKEEDASAEVVERHDGETLAGRWVIVDAHSDHGVLAMEVAPKRLHF